MPDITLRPAAPHESPLIFSFLTFAARMDESNEPIQKALTDDIPELALGVVNNLRNPGIGTLLLERLLNDCRTRFPGVSLSVRRDNPVVRLYERLGFSQYGAAFTNRVGTSSMTMLLRFS